MPTRCLLAEAEARDMLAGSACTCADGAAHDAAVSVAVRDATLPAGSGPSWAWRAVVVAAVAAAGWLAGRRGGGRVRP